MADPLGNVTHIASAGYHGEQRCRRCGALLHRASPDWLAYQYGVGWTKDSWSFYPYRSGDKVVMGRDWLWQSLALNNDTNFCAEEDKHVDNTYRFGSIVLEIPLNPNLPAEVRRDGALAGDGYRDALKRGHLPFGDPLTDAEILWLLGFDDEVAAHDQAWQAVTEP